MVKIKIDEGLVAKHYKDIFSLVPKEFVSFVNSIHFKQKKPYSIKNPNGYVEGTKGKVYGRYNTKTNVIDIYCGVSGEIPKPFVYYVLCHEIAHAALKTEDEDVANNFALNCLKTHRGRWK